MTFKPGRGVLRADVAIFYCEAVQARLCLIADMQLTVPLTVGDDGTSRMRLQPGVTIPE